MEALYDQRGSVYAWLHLNGHICGLEGENLAFVDGDSVYDWYGKHVGWWQDGYIRDDNGAIAMFTEEAKNLGFTMPMLQHRPPHPIKPLSPHKPVESLKPSKPKRLVAWSGELPF